MQRSTDIAVPNRCPASLLYTTISDLQHCSRTSHINKDGCLVQHHLQPNAGCNRNYQKRANELGRLDYVLVDGDEDIHEQYIVFEDSFVDTDHSNDK
jgi:hypothetical protein